MTAVLRGYKVMGWNWATVCLQETPHKARMARVLELMTDFQTCHL